MHIAKVIACFTLATVLVGCMTYRYGDRTFTDRKEADAASQADRDQILAGIISRPAPIAPLAKLVIPSKALILDRGLKPGGTDEARDYVATNLYLSYKAVTAAVIKRNIFAKTEVVESQDAGHVDPKPGEVVMYIYFPDSKTSGWYYASTSTKRTPLHSDTGNPDKVGRWKYFVDSVEALASDEPK